jgi:DNA-binding LytR/AlgR family response regulator
MVEKIKAIIVEDEPLNREELRYLLSLQGDVELVGEAASAPAGLELIEAKQPDLAFLDIEMETPGAGMSLAARLSQLPKPPQLVFVTGHPERAAQAFDYRPTHFLLKPVDDAKFAEALHRVRCAIKPKGPARIALRHTDAEGLRLTTFVTPKEILYLRSFSNSAQVRLVSGEVLQGIREPLAQFERIPGFFRIHASFLVNLSHAQTLKPRPGDAESYHLLLKGCADKLPVSRLKLTTLKDWLENARPGAE